MYVYMFLRGSRVRIANVTKSVTLVKYCINKNKKKKLLVHIRLFNDSKGSFIFCLLLLQLVLCRVT